jgi:NitT/TauT family transport system substrate-binding protein
MMKNKTFSHVLLFVLMAMILGACVPSQKAEQTNPPLRFEFTNRWGDYTLLVAKEKGFFEEKGLEVEPVYYNSYPDIYSDLASGQIDGAILTIGDVININSVSPVKVVGLSDDGGADAIIASPEIASIQDLRGKAVGVLTGTQYELMIVEMLQSANMSIGDITIVNVEPKDALIALKNGTVQATYTQKPYSSKAVENGYKIIYPTQKTRHFPNVIVFDKSVVEKRPDDVRAFLSAWYQVMGYRMQHVGETRDVAAKYLSASAQEIQPDDDQKLYNIEDNKRLFDANQTDSVFSITKVTADYLISIGALIQPVDTNELLDPSYLP